MPPVTHALHAGTARVEITPPVGLDLSGYVARDGSSTGMHDALYTRALVLDDGATRAALVVCDLVGFEGAFVAAARHRISVTTGIPESGIMIACTHTHSGPATLLLNQCGALDPGYMEALQTHLVRATDEAGAASKPVELGVGWGAFPEGLFNRRRDGSPIDSSVGAASLHTPAGETVAVLATYGCHPVVMTADNRLISADYPGMLARTLETSLGGTAFFLTGACGNVDPVRRGSFEDVQWLGENLAREVRHVIGRTQHSDARPLIVARTPLALPLQEVPGAEALRNAVIQHRRLLIEAKVGSVEERIQRAMLAWAESTLAQVLVDRCPGTVDGEVQLLRIGQLAIVGVSGELFSSLGGDIRVAQPGLIAGTFVVGYTNGDVGYIPDAAAYTGGGYEVNDAYKYYNYPAALSVEAGNMIVATARRLLAASESQ